MDAINPLLYITDWTPVPETIIDASQWFEDETTILRVHGGSEVSLAWFQAQGWVVVTSQKVAGSPTTRSTNVVNNNDDGESTASTTVTTDSFDYIYTLKRRKLQSERVLQDMITEFTSAYNEGRLLNDRRYDEIVTLYSVMLSKSESELSAITAESIPYDTIIDNVITALPTDFSTYSDAVDDLLDDYGNSETTRINTQFDNESAKAKSDLISRGMYNSTVWTSVSSGVEESRSDALVTLADKLSDRKLTATDRVYSLKSEMRSKLEGAAARLMDIKRQRGIGATELRNAVLSALLAMMERRDDDYPGMAELAKIAEGLGYGDGGAVRPS